MSKKFMFFFFFFGGGGSIFGPPCRKLWTFGNVESSCLLCPSHHSGGGSDRTVPTLLINALSRISFTEYFSGILYAARNTPPWILFSEYFSAIFSVTRNTLSRLSFAEYFSVFSWNISCDKEYFPLQYFYGVFCVTRNTFLQNMICLKFRTSVQKFATRSSHPNYDGCVCGRVAGCDKCDKSGQRSAVS